MFIAGIVGTNDEPNIRSKAAVENLAWPYKVLPFIEANNLFNLRPSIGLVPEMFSATLPHMSCPSRGTRMITNSVGDQTFYGDYASFLMDFWLARSVSAQLGVEVICPNIDPIRGRPDEVGDLQQYIWQGVINRSGYLRAWRPAEELVKFADIGFGQISDGSSNTLMFGEKHSVSLDINSVNWYKLGHRADGMPIDLTAF